jgi:GNAT superfamily N-acetyltransferase
MLQLIHSDVQDRLGLSFRRARNEEADARAFCRMSNSLYARKVNSRYYRWQFFETPFPTLLAFATTNDGELAGCYGIQLRNSTLGHHSLGMALDIMVAPAYQGKGLFRPLANYARQQVETPGPALLYVMANQRAHRAHVHGLGWTSVQVLNDYVRSTAGSSTLLRGHLVTSEVRQFNFADRRFLEDLESKVGAAFSIRVSRSVPDLQWRLFENPRYAYKVLRCTVASRLVGFLALKTFRNPESGAVSGDIVDVLWQDDDPELLEQLLLAGLVEFESQGIAEATSWFYTNTILDAAGHALGFRQIHRPRYFSSSILNPENTWQTEANHWRISMLDTDIY